MICSWINITIKFIFCLRPYFQVFNSDVVLITMYHCSMKLEHGCNNTPFVVIHNILIVLQVSVSCGIPDFRSRDGVYAKLSVEYPDLPDPQAMFDISYFYKNPRPFFKFARVSIHYTWLILCLAQWTDKMHDSIAMLWLATYTQKGKTTLTCLLQLGIIHCAQ